MADPALLTSHDPIADAARIVAAAVTEAHVARGAARLAIPGGSALAALGPARRRLAPAVWGRLRLTWVDERCVPHDHGDSNIGAAYRQHQLDASAPPERELPLFFEGETPDAARARVETGLGADFDGGLDVALLGLGEDGHIASLFPNHPALLARGLAAVVHDSPKPPSVRLTLTLPVLQNARTAVLLATGERKRPALEGLLRGERSGPAAALSNLTIVTDLKLGGSR